MKFKENDLVPTSDPINHRVATAGIAENMNMFPDNLPHMTLGAYAEGSTDEEIPDGVIFLKGSKEYKYMKKHDIPRQRIWLTDVQLEEYNNAE